jgi:TatD DNase family protein
MTGFIDVHTHLNMLEGSTAEVLAAASAAGVEKMITIGTGHDDLPLVMEYVKTLAPAVYGTLGFHPHDAKTWNEAGERFLLENLDHPRIVGVGEIGLDYYYEHSEPEVQKNVFRRQIEIALEKNLPIEIHTRDAEADTVAILEDYKGRLRGLFHCFTGTAWLAQEALRLGFNLSISGVVTFKNADALREVVKMVPLDRLHIETDAPFLTPAPFRGKKNSPSLMVHTAQCVADLKGITTTELARVTTQNAVKLFPKMKW